MSKNDQMLAILWMLSSNKKITAKQIAEKLELNIRTVYRYMDSLSASGVPIISDSGHNGGYSIIEDFHDAPLIFDLDEKKALLYATAEAQNSGYPFSDALNRALEKLKRYSTDEQDAILTRHLTSFEVSKQQISMQLRELIEQLTAAVTDEQTVEIDYRTKTEDIHQPRKINPYGVLFWRNKWYVVGFCHLRQAIRSFRVERIRQLTTLESHFDRPKDFSAKEFFMNSLLPENERGADKISLVITGRAESLDDLCNHWLMSYYLTERTLNQAIFVMEPTVLLTYVAPIIMTYGKSIQVLSPESCKRKLFELASDLMKYYQIDEFN